MNNGLHATSAVAKSAVSASYQAQVSRYTKTKVIAPMTGATKNTAFGPPISVKSAITAETPIGNVGEMPASSGDGVQPSGDATCIRFDADSHSAIGASPITRPCAINWLALT